MIFKLPPFFRSRLLSAARQPIPMEEHAGQPVCPLFGTCGGCQYQDIPYQQELRLKQDRLRTLFTGRRECPSKIWDEIVPSPRLYHYRSRLDLKLLKTRSQGLFMGFSPTERYRVVEAAACPLAMEAISDFLPALKQEAGERLPAKYRNANLVIKTGDDGRVFWGGIGRRSLRMRPEDYLWTEVNGRRIFFSLDTFFQANLSILPLVMDRIRGFGFWDRSSVFYDLYGGVGLFGLGLADRAAEVVLVEENPHAVRVAEYNRSFHGFGHFRIIPGRVEDVLGQLDLPRHGRTVGMIDPPRQGLGPAAAPLAEKLKDLKVLMYLSCRPEALLADWDVFHRAGWRAIRIIPFDFFPRTRHLETLLVMSPAGRI